MKENEIDRPCSTHGTKHRILMVTPEEKGPLRIRRRRWVNKIKMDLREIVWGGMDWIDLAQDRNQWRALMNTAMNPRVP
jgi:hypothetical protein